MRKGQIAKAFEEHQAPAKLEAKDPRVHYALSRVYRHLGQHEEASKEFQVREVLKSEDEAPTASFPGAPQN